MKRSIIVALLCLVLCISILPVSAFADQTVVIIGGPVEQTPAAAQTSSGNTVVTGGTASAVIVADGSNVTVSQSKETAAPVIVMPNGNVVAPQGVQTQPAETVTTTVELPVTAAQTLPLNANTLLNGIYQRINEERVKNSLGILGYDNALQATADLRAKAGATPVLTAAQQSPPLQWTTMSPEKT